MRWWSVEGGGVGAWKRRVGFGASGWGLWFASYHLLSK